MYMSNSTDSSATKRRSLKSYASRVFQESSVGLVSSVAQTVSKRRKIFKLLALIVCLTGFLYQGAVYLLHVLEYPTAVNIEVIRPNTLMVPSITFCDNNRINRRLFCEKFPDRCEEPDDALCREYPDYCGKSKTLKPKEEYYELKDTYNITNFMLQRHEFVTGFQPHVFEVPPENITGPYERKNSFDIYCLCYIINDRVNSALNVRTVNLEDVYRDFDYWIDIAQLTLRVSPEEVFLPGDHAGIYLSLHSPFDTAEPFYSGTFLRSGRQYLLLIYMEEEILEKSPYDTDCTDYIELWEQNGHSGPRSKVGCREKRLAERDISCFGCVRPYDFYSGLGRACEPEEYNRTCNITLDDSFYNCKDDCRKTIFRVEVKDFRLGGYSKKSAGKILEREDEIEVILRMKTDGVRVYKHNPKYMAVEVFSCIGGFIGIWLGISLLDVTDVFEGIVRIFHFSLKKNKNNKKNEENTQRIEEKKMTNRNCCFL